MTENAWMKVVRNISTPELKGDLVSEIVPMNGEFSIYGGNDHFAAYGSTGIPSTKIKRPVTDEPRVVNFWLTRLATTSGEDLFEGFRSATLVHYGEPNAEVRRSATHSNVRELLLAAALRRLEKLDPAERKRLEELGSPLEIQLTSIDLQSAWAGEGSLSIERRTISERREAFEDLAAAGALELNIGGLRIGFKITLLNIPTHPLEYGSGQGWAESELNEQREIPQFIERARTFAESASRLTAARIWRLIEEIQLILRNRWHRRPNNIYGLPARFALLAYLVGDSVHFNCRSGKDRTGMLDTEVKFLAYQLERVERELEVSDYAAPPLGSEQPAWRVLLLHSGNDRIQELNTGYRGSLLSPVADELEADLFVLRVGLENWVAFKGDSERSSV